jgi:uncharacterized protein YcfL
MKKLALLLPILLGGCASTQQVVVKTERVVVMPEKTLFYCPGVGRFPEPSALTDSQVAQLIVNMNNNNSVCQRNMSSIKRVLEEAKKTTENTQ